MTDFGSSRIVIPQTWSQLKSSLKTRQILLQYDEQSDFYELFAIDGPMVFLSTLFRGVVPAGADQAASDTDKADFETSYKASANKPLTPRTDDGQAVVSPSIFFGDVTMNLIGAGDTTAGRGQGALFNLSREVAGDVTLEWFFNDTVWMVGGGIAHSGAELGDWMDYKLIAPAGIVTVAAGNTGNCNLATSPFGASTLIVPAAGNGTHSVDLATAALVPLESQTGYWLWDDPATGRGIISAGPAGASKYQLFTVAVDLAKFVTRVPFLGTSQASLTVPSIRPRKAIPMWKHKATLHNGGHASLKLAWHLVTARKTTT